MFENGVFFGEPLDGSPEKQKQAIRSYYEFMLEEQVSLFRQTNGREPDSLFEAGSSVGWFLDVARARFSVAGCDANGFAAQVGREKMGLDIRGCTLSRYPARTGAYDLAVALDYIEHTYTPAADLMKLHKMVRPGGVLLLKTFLEEHDPTGSYVHPLFHASHFFGRTLKFALERAGWAVKVFDDERERIYAQVTVLAIRQ